MKGPRNPWARLAKLAFSVGPAGGKLSPKEEAEMSRLRRQIDEGYAKMGKRARAGTARAADEQRAFIAPHLPPNFRATKGAVARVSALLEQRFGGAWSFDRTRQLVRSLKRPSRRVPRPFTDPNNYEDTGDM